MFIGGNESESHSYFGSHHVRGLLDRGTGGGEVADPPFKLGFWGGGGGARLCKGKEVVGEDTGLE